MIIYNSFLKGQDYIDLNKNFEVLKKLRKGDKLAVKKEGQLEALSIDERGFLQGPIRTVKSIIYGGHNRTAVSSYLEQLATSTEKFIQEHHLLDPNFKQISPEDYEKFYHLLKVMTHKMSNIEYGYRNYANYYLPMHTSISLIFDRFNEAKKTFEENIKKNNETFKDIPSTVDFQEPVEERELENRLPRGRTLDDIKRLVKEAKEDLQKVPEWKKTAFFAASFFAVCITGPLLLLSLVTMPITFAVRLYSKDQLIINTPFTWLWKNMERTFPEINNDIHCNGLLWGYAYQVLSFPEIKDEHIEMFSKLADYVKELDLQHVDLSDRTYEINPTTINVENTIQLIKIAASKHTCNEIRLPDNAEEKQEITNLLTQLGFEKGENCWVRKTS